MLNKANYSLVSIISVSHYEVAYSSRHEFWEHLVGRNDFSKSSKSFFRKKQTELKQKSTVGIKLRQEQKTSILRFYDDIALLTLSGKELENTLGEIQQILTKNCNRKINKEKRMI